MESRYVFFYLLILPFFVFSLYCFLLLMWVMTPKSQNKTTERQPEGKRQVYSADAEIFGAFLPHQRG